MGRFGWLSKLSGVSCEAAAAEESKRTFPIVSMESRAVMFGISKLPTQPCQVSTAELTRRGGRRGGGDIVEKLKVRVDFGTGVSGGITQSWFRGHVSKRCAHPKHSSSSWWWQGAEIFPLFLSIETMISSLKS